MPTAPSAGVCYAGGRIVIERPAVVYCLGADASPTPQHKLEVLFPPVRMELPDALLTTKPSASSSSGSEGSSTYGASLDLAAALSCAADGGGVPALLSASHCRPTPPERAEHSSRRTPKRRRREAAATAAAAADDAALPLRGSSGCSSSGEQARAPSLVLADSSSVSGSGGEAPPGDPTADSLARGALVVRSSAHDSSEDRQGSVRAGAGGAARGVQQRRAARHTGSAADAAAVLQQQQQQQQAREGLCRTSLPYAGAKAGGVALQQPWDEAPGGAALADAALLRGDGGGGGAWGLSNAAQLIARARLTARAYLQRAPLWHANDSNNGAAGGAWSGAEARAGGAPGKSALLALGLAEPALRATATARARSTLGALHAAAKAPQACGNGIYSGSGGGATFVHSPSAFELAATAEAWAGEAQGGRGDAATAAAAAQALHAGFGGDAGGGFYQRMLSSDVDMAGSGDLDAPTAHGQNVPASIAQCMSMDGGGIAALGGGGGGGESMGVVMGVEDEGLEAFLLSMMGED